MNQQIEEILRQREPGEAVLRSLQRLLDEDAHLLEVDANERSLTHRVGIYLQNEFAQWNVDCEYNRDNHEPKELYLEGGNPDAYDVNAQTVYPDIIVHERGTNRNYLVIEFKKASSTASEEKDFAKLRAFLGQLNYEHALFIELAVGGQGIGVSKAEWVST
ncbi:hypothetical protein [Sedimenticola selenatireducens]|uniref:hypothetical protein n=1 Tax=Sedimenticola selenatireducens TaxID=191960 RepID=UPI002AAC29DF|nr:hypothetical protein [Sedimenticola selenatireducens]